MGAEQRVRLHHLALAVCIHFGSIEFNHGLFFFLAAGSW